MKKLWKVKDGYIDQWYGAADPAEIESTQEDGIAYDEIVSLAKGWDVPVADLMEQVEEI